MANHLRVFIASLGYEVKDVFESGEQFLKKTDWDFDVVLLDIMFVGKPYGFRYWVETN